MLSRCPAECRVSGDSGIAWPPGPTSRREPSPTRHRMDPPVGIVRCCRIYAYQPVRLSTAEADSNPTPGPAARSLAAEFGNTNTRLGPAESRAAAVGHAPRSVDVEPGNRRARQVGFEFPNGSGGEGQVRLPPC